MISKVQQIRKNKEFNVTDRIKLYYQGDTDVDNCVLQYNEYIKHETLSTEIIKKDNLTEEYDLNGHNCKLEVER